MKQIWDRTSSSPRSEQAVVLVNLFDVLFMLNKHVLHVLLEVLLLLLLVLLLLFVFLLLLYLTSHGGAGVNPAYLPEATDVAVSP